jgi:hypothetical protein
MYRSHDWKLILHFLSIYLSLYLSIYLSIYGSPVLFVGPWLLFQFLNLYTIGRTPWTGDQPVTRPLPTHSKNADTSMSRVGFEPTIPVFERAKTVHALDRAATMIGYTSLTIGGHRYKSQMENSNFAYCQQERS